MAVNPKSVILNSHSTRLNSNFTALLLAHHKHLVLTNIFHFIQFAIYTLLSNLDKVHNKTSLPPVTVQKEF